MNHLQEVEIMPVTWADIVGPYDCVQSNQQFEKCLDVLMMNVVNSLLPIVLMVALGAGLVQFGFMGEVFCKGLDRLVYYVLLPLAIIASLMKSDLLAGHAATLALATLASLILAYIVSFVMRLGPMQTGPLVQMSFRGNLMFVGLPVVLYAYNGQSEASALAILAVVPIIVLYNVLAVTVLSIGQGGISWKLIPRVTRSVVTNPLIIACVVGAILSAIPWRLPKAMMDSIALLGKTASPLALLSLGGALMFLPVKGRIAPAFVGSMIKVVITPLIAYGLARVFVLDPQATRIVLILAATPTAVASYVLVSQFKRDASLAAAGVVISTLLSMFTLAAVMLMTV